MTFRSPLCVLLLVLAARSALAQQATGPSPPPLLDPPSSEPPPEVGFAVAQGVVGAMGATLAGFSALLIAAGTKSDTAAYVGIAAAPAVGSWIICGFGRTSRAYEGGCAPTFAGGYLGAVLLAIPMGYLAGAELAPRDSEGGLEHAIATVYGAAFGLIVGTAVGATLGWHLSKRSRGGPATVAFGAPPPPPRALAAWSDLRARPVAARAPAAVGVPLLSLRF